VSGGSTDRGRIGADEKRGAGLHEALHPVTVSGVKRNSSGDVPPSGGVKGRVK
jgi:hypothetical protein